MSLKILRVASNIYPDGKYGLDLHTHHMSRIQGNMGHEVTVLTSDRGDKEKQRIEYRDGYKLIRLEEIISPFDNSIFLKLLPKLKKLAPKYDIVHAHSHLFYSTNVSALMSRLLQNNFVVTNHGLYSLNVPIFLEKTFVHTIGKFTFNSASRVFCYTNKAKNNLLKLGVKTPIKVIPNGIDTDIFVPNSSIEKKRQILFVGRLKRGKGVKYLIEAFQVLIRKYENLKLKIVGEGPLKQELIKKCEDLGIRENVFFEGIIPNQDLPEIYNESLFFVSPTLTEATVPRVVMEAWACEIPVIISDIPSVRGKIGKGGITVPIKSPKKLANGMEELLENKEMRKKMGKKGLKKVKDNYSWEETVKRTTEEYYSVIKEKN